MKIVPLDPARIEDVFRLYDGYNRPKAEAVTEETARSVLARIREQGGEVFVVLRDADLLGTYTIYVCQNLTHATKPFAVIENVICAPEVRRQGIGTRLMEHAKAYAIEQGCFKVMLQTGMDRERNHAFYESCGFSFDKRGYQVRFGE